MTPRWTEGITGLADDCQLLINFRALCKKHGVRPDKDFADVTHWAAAQELIDLCRVGDAILQEIRNRPQDYLTVRDEKLGCSVSRFKQSKPAHARRQERRMIERIHAEKSSAR